MKKLLLLSGIVLGLFVTSCSKTIDATSMAKMNASAEEIMATLNEEQKEEFEEAFQTVIFSFDTEEEVKKEIHGKTAKQIIEKARKIEEQEEREEKEAEEIGYSIKIDGSSEAKLLASIEEIGVTLDEWQKVEFQEALYTVLSQYSFDMTEKEVLQKVHGKTVKEIIEKARKIENGDNEETEETANFSQKELMKRAKKDLERARRGY